MKRFLEWIGLKEKLHTREHKPPFVREGDFWWCALGENIGTEVNGKSKDFTRPVVILKKFGRVSFLVIPTTTQKRTGTWFVQFSHRQIEETAMLCQARVVNYKRLHSKMGEIDASDFLTIKEAFVRLFI